MSKKKKKEKNCNFDDVRWKKKLFKKFSYARIKKNLEKLWCKKTTRMSMLRGK